MATYYWVGGTGTWNASSTTNWASSSNGAGGAGVPTSTDNVIIDSSSGTGTITCTAGVCADLTVTATQAIILGASFSTLSVYGSLTYPATGSFSSNTSVWTLTFAGTTTGKTITLNGKSLYGVIFNGAGSVWTLGSALLTNSTITLTNGTLDTSSSGNYSITISGSAVINYGAGTKTLNLNGSTVTASGFGSSTNITGFTLNAGTSSITLSNPTPVFYGNGLTFYNVTITPTSTTGMTLNGQCTFNNLTLSTKASDGILAYTIAANQTVNGTLTLGTSNTGIRRLFLSSATLGTQYTITATTVASLSDVDFRDIAFSSSQTGTRLGDCGGNSNITFDSPKTVYFTSAGSSQNWGANVWSTISGGSVNTNNFPLAQDTAIIDNNSGTSLTISLGTSQAWNIGSLNFSSRTNSATINWMQGENIHGSVTLSSAVSLGGSSTGHNYTGRGNTQTITTAGKTLLGPIYIKNIGGTVELGDALTISSSYNGITLSNGTFDAKTYNVTIANFSSSVSTTRTLNMGTGTWTLSGTGTVWNTGTTTGLTFNVGTSNILLSDITVIARVFTGGALTFNKITIGGTTGISTTTFGSVSGTVIGELASNKTVAHTIIFSALSTTVTTWSVKGTVGNVVTVNSSSAGAAVPLTITNKTTNIDYLNVKDITSSVSPYTFYVGANSTNSGNNTGVAFIERTTSTPTTAYLLTSGTSFTVPLDWNSSNNSIYMLGAGGGGSTGVYSGGFIAAGAGGGGGGFTKITNFTTTASSVISYTIGTSAANTNGGDTTWNSGVYTAGGGKRGNSFANASVQVSTGGAGGTGSTYDGGSGGAGATGNSSTIGASGGAGGGGGGGAAGPNGLGGSGGTGSVSTSSNTAAGGGGGGNGGGSNGGNGTTTLSGAGGNNFAGTGGATGSSVSGSTPASPTYGGGGAGTLGSAAPTGGAPGIDFLNTTGGSGGKGGAGQAANATANLGYGGGGSGGSVSGGSTSFTSNAGAPGVIFVVYTPYVAPQGSGFGFRLANTGILYVPTTSQFDEISQSTIGVKPTAFYALQFDEVTNPGVPGRYLNTGVVQTQGIIDEITGIL